jgi:predicted nucleic acid-binding Zn ribbon protein
MTNIDDTVCLVCGLKIIHQAQHQTSEDCIDALLKEIRRLNEQLKLKNKDN